MGETPDEIRREITLTRERMTETLAALRERANLKKRVSVRLHGWFGRIGERFRSLAGGPRRGRDGTSL